MFVNSVSRDTRTLVSILSGLKKRRTSLPGTTNVGDVLIYNCARRGNSGQSRYNLLQCGYRLSGEAEIGVLVNGIWTHGGLLCKDCRERQVSVGEPQELLQQGEMRSYGATRDNLARNGSLILER